MTDLQFVTESSIRGYHVYKSMWNPEIGETLSTKKEHNNPHYKFTVAVMKGKLRVGHIPKEIQRYGKQYAVQSRTKGEDTPLSKAV